MHQETMTRVTSVAFEQFSNESKLMNKFVVVELNVGVRRRKLRSNLTKKMVGVEVREKEGHLLPGRRVGVGAMRRISGVREPELTPDGFGVGVPGLEDLGGTHQSSPILKIDGIQKLH